MRVNAHQHFWRLSRGDYDWLTPDLAPLYRDFEPADLAPLLAASGISASILVQAAETDAETDFLLHIAERTPFVAGVVGWVDFASPEAPARIAALARNPLLKGLRPMLQDLDDDAFILRDACAPALEAMVQHGLRLDALVRPRHLRWLPELHARYRELPIVIDHAAKPAFPLSADSDWARDLAAVAADGLTCCKLSGLVTEVGPGWNVASLSRCFETVLDLFGYQRVMWGSDWPVLTLEADYGEWLAAAEALLAGRSAHARAAIFGVTARYFYGLGG